MADGEVEGKATQALTYIDAQRLEEGVIEPEYIVWVGQAIQDGVKNGVPEEYVEKHLRKWVRRSEKEQENMMCKTATGIWVMGRGVQGRVIRGLGRVSYLKAIKSPY